VVVAELDFVKPSYSFKKKEDVKLSGKKTKVWSDEDAKAKKPFFKDSRIGKHRNKDIFHSDDDSFTRSKKLKDAVKQEKNIEDIAQNLTDRTGETIIVPDVLNLKEFSEKI
jgi:hypothetical protein